MAIDKRILKMGGDLSGYAPDEIQVKNISNVTSGTLSIANGGTGLSTTPTNGQLLIGSGSSYSLATITAGSNIGVTNGSGTITVSLQDTISLSVVTASIGFNGGSFTGTTISGTIGQLTTLTASSVTGTDAKFNYVDYNNAAYSGGSTPALVEGRLFYDQNNLSLTEITDQGTLVNLGKQLTLRVRNSTGATLSKGKIVRITGNNGNTPSVNTASWDNDSTSANTLAVVMADISDTQFGYVLLTGLLKGVNTNGMTSGQMLYLSSSGDYTNVTPSSQYHEVRIGQVINDGVQGTIFVRIQNGYELNELHDVDAASPAYGDLLSWTSNGGNNQWRNTKQLTGSYGLTGSLSATDQISGSTLVGNGASITSITASNITNFTTDVRTQFSAGTNITIVNGQISSTASGGSSGSGSNTTASFSNSSTWTFTHNLNNRTPIIQTLDSNYNQIIPQNIELTDANTATITFPTSESGYAIASLGGTTVSASYAANAGGVSSYESAWTSYSVAWTGQSSDPVLGNGTLTGYYKQIGKTVFVRVNLVIGSSTTLGSGAWRFSLPVNAVNADAVVFPCSILDEGYAWYQATVTGRYSGFTDKVSIIGQSSGSNSSQGVSDAFPIAWGTNDKLQFNGTYEAA